MEHDCGLRLLNTSWSIDVDPSQKWRVAFEFSPSSQQCIICLCVYIYSCFYIYTIVGGSLLCTLTYGLPFPWPYGDRSNKSRWCPAATADHSSGHGLFWRRPMCASASWYTMTSWRWKSLSAAHQTPQGEEEGRRRETRGRRGRKRVPPADDCSLGKRWQTLRQHFPSGITWKPMSILRCQWRLFRSTHMRIRWQE